jgi:hypothetical protein
MPVWLQILFGIISAIGVIFSIILAYIVIKLTKNRDSKEDKQILRQERLEIERRLTKLETTSEALDGFMAEILLRNLKM